MKFVGQVYRRSGPMLKKEKEAPNFLQTYFFDPEMQAKFRTDRFISEKDTKKDYELWYEIFNNLYEISNKFQNSYLCDFFSIHEFIQNNNLNSEEVIFVIDTVGKPNNDLRHPGRFHSPSALTEMALLRPDAPVEKGEQKNVCWVRNPSSEKTALFFW